MAKPWQFLQGHPKPAFSEKVERGDQGKFFKNLQQSSPCYKGPKALWRKLNYSLIKILLKWKDWRIFWRTQRLQKCQNGQVMAIIARSPKTRLFRKSAKGNEEKFFKNRLKSSPRLKSPIKLWRKWHFFLTSLHLKGKDWKRFWHKQRL